MPTRSPRRRRPRPRSCAVRRFGVRERREPGLELRRRRVDAAGQQGTAPGAVGLGVAFRRRGIVGHGALGEEHREQAGEALDVDRASGAFGCGVQTGGELFGGRRELLVGRVVEVAQGRERGRHRQRIARERPRLVHVARRRDPLHELAATPVGGRRQASADDLAHDAQVGRYAVQLLGAAAGDAEAGDHLVEDEQGTSLVRPRSEELEESGVRRDDPHVGRHGLDEDRCEVAGVGRTERVGVIPRDDRRGRGGRLGHPGTGGDPLGGEPGAGVGEQAVDVSVVGAGELEDMLASGNGAGQADRAHRGLGAGRGHPQHLDARDPIGDLLRQLNLAFGGSPEGRPACGRPGDGLYDRGVRVAEDQRAPRAHVVDVGVAVDVGDGRAAARGDEDRVAADRPHRPHR